MKINIRVATVADAQELLNIYAYYVENTAITFEYVVPSLEEFENRIATVLENYPYLVAEIDGRIVGYVYGSRFRVRAAYNWCAGTSIYLHKDYRNLGIGKLLYRELEQILKKQNVVHLYAAVTEIVEPDQYITNHSKHFHEAAGYELCARYYACGSKFGNWYTTIELQKQLNERTYPPKEFIPFPEIGYSYECDC